MAEKFDAVIIGAGMSGLAAGIRLAMFDKKVIILEQHSISGGLNSYYSRRIKETKEIINFDVGLHALTNYAKKGEKGKPFTKLLKQLRLPYSDFSLKQQSYSLIKFKSASLKFSNDFELLESEVKNIFPKEIDAFQKFVKYVGQFNEVDLKTSYQSARSVLVEYFDDELLIEMLIAPLLIYGSAWEDDMDFSQFVVMFKSLYFEGFSRPEGGVRTIINLLMDKYRSLGGELAFKVKVQSIDVSNPLKKIITKEMGIIETGLILSSAGVVETQKMIGVQREQTCRVGKLSFLESIFLTQSKLAIQDFGATIVFYNKMDKYLYRRPESDSDFESAVICLPDNYESSNQEGYGTIRVTYMANYNHWNSFKKDHYKKRKEDVFEQAKHLSDEVLGVKNDIIFRDVFSPTTIKRYTGHLGGTVYGSPDKLRDGNMGVSGVYIMGTDQGFLGIVGSMLSGISMANFYGLMQGRPTQ